MSFVATLRRQQRGLRKLEAQKNLKQESRAENHGRQQKKPAATAGELLDKMINNSRRLAAIVGESDATVTLRARVEFPFTAGR